MGKRSRSRSNRRHKSRSKDKKRDERPKRESKWSTLPPADIDPSLIEK
jgi:hypothetical protein